jgi:hypothetical protein
MAEMDKKELLQDAPWRDVKRKEKALKKAGGTGGTGGKEELPGADKRPPGMPGFMPPGTMEPKDEKKDEPSDFGDEEAGDEDADYTKVQQQTDFNEAEDVGIIAVEVNQSEDDTEMGTASVSPKTAERVEDRLLELINPKLLSQAKTRGDEHSRMNDANTMRDASVNRSAGSQMITINVRDKDPGRLGRMIGTLNRMEGIKLRAQLYVEGDPDSMDVILEVDNVMIGKLLERALSNEMTKAIEPKLTKEVRMRSTEGVRFKEVGGQTGAASSGGYDIQDKLTELLELGKEEEIYKLVQGWNHDMEIEKVAYFLRYNKTGLDERHCGD